MSMGSGVSQADGRQTFAGVDAVRAGGGLVHIRPVVTEDADALRALHTGVSDRSMYLHFFGSAASNSATLAVSFWTARLEGSSLDWVGYVG